jgi:hypothetical protein
VEFRPGARGAGRDHLIQQAGIQRARRHGVDVDLCIAQLAGERLGESHDGRLRRRVRAEARERCGRATAGQVDDLAVPPGAEERDGGAAHERRAEQVDLNRAHPLVPVHLLERADRAVDAGVVDENVERRHQPRGFFRDATAGGGIGDIPGDRVNGGAGRVEPRELAAHLLEQRRAAGDQEDARPRAHEALGDDPSEPLVAPRDDGTAAAERKRRLHHDSSGRTPTAT